MNLARLGIKKSRREAAFLAAASITAILATAVIAAAPIYFDSIERLGVRKMVSESAATHLGSWVRIREVTFNPAAIAEVRKSLQAAGEELGTISRRNTIFLRSGQLNVSRVNDRSAPPAVEMQYQSISGDSPDISIVSGAMPSLGAEEIEVAIMDAVAEELGIAVGDVLHLTIPPTTISHSSAVVTGIFSINDPADESWLGLSSSIFNPKQGATGGRPPIIALADEKSLDRISRRGIAQLGEIWVLYYTDIPQLIELDLEAVLELTDGFTGSVLRDLPASTAFVGFRTGYQTLQKQLSFANTTTIISGSMFLAFAFLLLAIHANIIASRWRREDALLQARGSNKVQSLRTVLIYGLFLFVLPAVSGPLISWLAVPHLGRLAAFSHLTGGQELPRAILPEQFIWSTIAALVTLALYGWLMIQDRSNGLPVSPAQRWASGSPWFWRANLDLGVIIAAAAVILELNGRGSLFIQRSDGDATLSFLAASVPVAASVGSGLLALRILVWIRSPLERLSRIQFHAMISVALKIFARSTMQHAALVFITAGAISVSINALGLAATLKKNAEDRVNFLTAADVRVSGMDGARGERNASVFKIIAESWVKDHTWGTRASAVAGTSEAASDFEMLSLDPERFAAKAWFRSDFAELDLPSLMASIIHYESPQSLSLPDDSIELIASFRLEHAGSGRIDIWTRVMDGDESTHTLRMIPDDSASLEKWQTWRTEISSELRRPISLIGVQVYEPPTAALGNAVVLEIDDVRAVTTAGEISLPSFSDPALWHPLEASLANNTEIEAAIGTRSDDSTLHIAMGKGTVNGIRGIYLPGTEPIGVPLLISSGFSDATGLSPGDRFTGRAYGHLIPFEIRGLFDLFPTMSDHESPFAVANVRALMNYIERVSEPFISNSAELFLELTADRPHHADRRSFIKSMAPNARLMDREEIYAEAFVGLAAAAGWRVVGIVIAAVAVAIASAATVAFSMHQQNHTAINRAVMEAMGASKLSIAIEHLIRSFVAISIGVMIGVLSGTLIVRFISERMTRSETGEAVLPPMTLVIDWLPIIGVAATLLLSALLPIAHHSLRQKEGVIRSAGNYEAR